MTDSMYERKWNECQYEFMQGKLTMNAQFRLNKCVNKANGRCFMEVFVDFAGAFSNFHFSTILELYFSAGCRWNKLLLRINYFSNRKECIMNI